MNGIVENGSLIGFSEDNNIQNYLDSIQTYNPFDWSTWGSEFATVSKSDFEDITGDMTESFKKFLGPDIIESELDFTKIKIIDTDEMINDPVERLKEAYEKAFLQEDGSYLIS
jgi:hypothetical protein